MSFFGNIIGGIGKAIGGGGSGMSPQQSAPQVDPRLKAMQDRQISQAQQFREGMQGMKQEQYNQSDENARNKLAQSMVGVGRNMNQRGMLYSGLKAGAENDAASQVAQENAQQRAGINQQVEDQANQLDSQALGTAFGVQGMQQNLNNAAYQQALTNKQNQFSVMGSLGAAAGSLAGGLAGSK